MEKIPSTLWCETTSMHAFPESQDVNNTKCLTVLVETILVCIPRSNHKLFLLLSLNESIANVNKNIGFMSTNSGFRGLQRSYQELAAIESAQDSIFPQFPWF